LLCTATKEGILDITPLASAAELSQRSKAMHATVHEEIATDLRRSQERPSWSNGHHRPRGMLQ
jgi:hypothetical protein